MWKVEKLAEGKLTILNISGRLQGEELTDLEQVVASESRTGKIVLDLRGVKLVDQDSIMFLCRCEAGGTTLRNCPAYVREWITKGTHRK
jgi:anti-anti-sigma regulatory factor